MKWITRERPKIDRIACPWLIARFIDESPEFLYVPVELVMDVAGETGAVPYDVPGVELTHAGELCSFDAFLKKYKLKEPALQRSGGSAQGSAADPAGSCWASTGTRTSSGTTGWPITLMVRPRHCLFSSWTCTSTPTR